jgi:hypothetical protein
LPKCSRYGEAEAQGEGAETGRFDRDANAMRPGPGLSLAREEALGRAVGDSTPCGARPQLARTALYGLPRRYDTGRENPMDPIRRPIHPRIQRRRDLAASINFPAELEEAFAKFSRPGGLAVLKIISREVVRHDACTLTVDAIAELADIDRNVVKVALRTAKAEGLIKDRAGSSGA